MYAVLVIVILLGIWNTVAGSNLTIGGEYDYREAVSVSFRSSSFQPDAELMAEAPLGFQLHALVAFGLFALWPFTRLVHVFSARWATSPALTSSTAAATTTSSAATDPAEAGTGSGEGSGRDRRGEHHAEGVPDRTGPRPPGAGAATSTSGRSAHTVYGGHERVLRQTLIALRAGRGLEERESPGDATVQVVQGRVTLVVGEKRWNGSSGDLLIIPDARHALEAVEDSVVLLTVAKSVG